MKTLLFVALGGALGAVSRYLVSGWVGDRWVPYTAFPWGTLTVNVLGSFLLGLLMAVSSSGAITVSPGARLVLGAGFLGAFTTFSTFSFQTVEALRQGLWRMAILNIVLSMAVCLLFCWLGIELGSRTR